MVCHYFLPTVDLVALVVLMPKDTPGVECGVEPIKRRHTCAVLDK